MVGNDEYGVASKTHDSLAVLEHERSGQRAGPVEDIVCRGVTRIHVSPDPGPV